MTYQSTATSIRLASPLKQSRSDCVHLSKLSLTLACERRLWVTVRYATGEVVVMRPEYPRLHVIQPQVVSMAGQPFERSFKDERRIICVN